MKWNKLPNRTKIVSELSRRYEEVLRRAENNVTNDEEATQFLTLLAHYMEYVKKNEITKDATAKLFKQKDLLASDAVLIKEAEDIIEQLNIDKAVLVRFAKSKNIKTDNYKFKNGQRITGDIEFSYYLNHLDEYLDLPSDAQSISDIPRTISNLLSMNFIAQTQGSKTKKLTEMRNKYIELQNEYSKKLKLEGVYIDYLRIEDFRALELVWKEVYHEGEASELLLFHFEYGHLFEKNRYFSDGQLTDAKDFVARHVTHIQRLNNYLIDSIEDVPKLEKFGLWTVEHFGPTLFSLIIIIILYYFLNWIGIKIDLNTLKDFS